MFNRAKAARGIVLWFVVMMTITGCLGSITSPDFEMGGSFRPVESVIQR